MAATLTDTRISSIAWGFTMGFGYLTAWSAFKLTRKHRAPLRSMFIWMIWTEVVVNQAIGVLAWLFLGGYIKPSIPVFFVILCLWVPEIQFIMQIIVNRVALVSSNRRLTSRIKWGVAIFITCIQITVFCIWIPANARVSERYILINRYWDKTTKFLILLTDVYLNVYFIRCVQHRLVVQSGLRKYASLVRFNTKIIIVSIAMDFLIIGTMFLQNGAVFMQFHGVAYTVKLKIELSMTSLIRKIARESISERRGGDMVASSTTEGPRTITMQSQKGKGRPAGSMGTTTVPSQVHVSKAQSIAKRVYPSEVKTDIRATGEPYVGGDTGVTAVREVQVFTDDEDGTRESTRRLTFLEVDDRDGQRGLGGSIV